MNETIAAQPVSPPRAGIQPAASMQAFGSSQLHALLARAARPGVLSFAVGMPAEETFPQEALAAAARQVTAEASSFQYGMPLAALKERIVALMATRGVVCSPEQVFLTAGAQQGIDLMTRLLVEPGDSVMVEQPVFEGTLLALKSRGAQITALETSPQHGLDVDALEARLQGGARPACLFLIPDGHNPLGIDLPTTARTRLVALARRYGLPLVEDDAYGFLWYGEGPKTQPLCALDDQWVVYLGTFSKIIAPALRVAWIIAPPSLHANLSSLKHGSDIDSTTVSQRIVSQLLTTWDIAEHCNALRHFYRERRDALLAALQRHCVALARWQQPTTGFYVWVALHPPLDATRVLEIAIEEEGVAFSPGSAFAVSGARSVASCLRLSFARLAPAEIEEGVVRLRRAIERAQALGD